LIPQLLKDVVPTRPQRRTLDFYTLAVDDPIGLSISRANHVEPFRSTPARNKLLTDGSNLT